MRSLQCLLMAIAPPVFAHGAVSMSAFMEPTTGTLSLEQTRSFNGWSPNEAARATYNDSAYLATGWATLEVHTCPDVDDETAALAAGTIEGSLTAHRIFQAAMNSGVGPEYTLPKGVQEFVNANNDFIAMMQATAKKLGTPANRAYWHHVGLVYKQLEGIHAGYTRAAKKAADLPPLTLSSILALNMGDEVGNFEGYKPGEGVTPRALPTFGSLQPFLDAGKCSALIKLIDGGSDIFIAQETWSSFESQLRVYKLYDFPYTLTGDAGGGRVPARRVSFSSYPAAIASGDDFYVLSSGLVVQETTIGNSNPELIRAFVSPLTVMEWTRNVVANRLASSGVAWPGLYNLYNSGSYNNQNMVLDYERFVLALSKCPLR